MTRAQTKALMPVLVAWSERRPIQVRLVGSLGPETGSSWSDVPGHECDFDDPNLEWRVKPEPREFWLVVGKGPDDGLLRSKPVNLTSSLEAIHVREVVE